MALGFFASLLSAWAVGTAVGASWVPEPVAAPQPSPEVIVKTKEVERKIEVPFVPSDCQDALGMVPDLLASIDKYEAILGGEDQILADAHTAIGKKDINALNAVVARQRKIKDDSLEYLLAIRSKSEDITKAVQRCEAEKN